MRGDLRFVHHIQLRFADLDALQHVNNAVYLTYLESARIAYWLHATRRIGLAALDMILARVEIDYRSPVVLGEDLDVGVRTVSLGRASFVMGFQIVVSASGRLVAEARKVLVYYDFAANRALPLPESIRALLREQDPDLVEAV